MPKGTGRYLILTRPGNGQHLSVRRFSDGKILLSGMKSCHAIGRLRGLLIVQAYSRDPSSAESPFYRNGQMLRSQENDRLLFTVAGNSPQKISASRFNPDGLSIAWADVSGTVFLCDIPSTLERLRRQRLKPRAWKPAKQEF